MHVLREWIHRLWSTLRPGRRDDDLEEELRLHLELVAEEARRRGHDPDDAVRIARLEAGGRSQAMDALRDQRGLPWLDDMVRDVGYGLRTLKRSPGFTATATLSLALGIGANTGIFSVLDQVLLRLLPVRAPERLVLLAWNGPHLARQERGTGSLMSYPLCLELQQRERFFEGVFCRSPTDVNLSTGKQYQVVTAELVSGSYFPVLGVRAERGRLIAPLDDARPGDHPVAVLSYDYWKTSLGGADDVVGRRILVNSHPMTVIGVAAAGFRGMDVGEPAALWMPAMMAREATLEFSRVLDRRAFWMHVFGRLKPGVTADEAKAGLQPWFTAMLDADTRREDFPQAGADQRRAFLASTIDVLPGDQGWSSLRGDFAEPLWVLMVGTTLLLLLACLNVASLLLARAAERGHELTTRMALGATRGRITRQLVVESLLIALAGGAAGLAAAPLVARVLLLFVPDGGHLSPAMDLRIFAFALLASIGAGALCGLAPALRPGQRSLASSINGRSTAAGTSVRFRKLIVGAQLALTLVLLAGAGLFAQTLSRLYTKDFGFDREKVLMFGLNPAGVGYSEADAPRVMQDVLDRLRQAPGVERAALANNTMLASMGPSRVLTIDATPRLVLERPVPMMRVSPAFFATVGVEVIAGREFGERDTLDLEKTGFRSIIVNETFARHYFDNLDPVGRRVGMGNLPDTPTNIEIVGVVKDFNRRYVRDGIDPEHIFVPFAQAGSLAGGGTFYVRVRGEPASAFPSVRAAVAGVAPALPVLNLTTLEDQITRALRSEVMLATLSSGFGTVALILSVVGLFGVMSFVVTQRTQEIGMRMALGATRPAAMWLVMRDALATIGGGALAGLVAGVTAGLLAAPWLTTVLYGVSPSDVATFAATTGVMTIVALAACVIPAGRAAALSPMVAIRDQPESMWRAARLHVRRAMKEMSAGSTGTVASPATLISDVAGTVRRAESFPDAVDAALTTLRERVRARFIMLLARGPDGYRCSACAIPVDGVLVNRLTHYPHPLPLAAGDFESWGTWAREFRPAHIGEIERLAGTGARMAVPMRTKHELVGVMLLGPPDGREDFNAGETQLLSGAADVFALLIENARLNERALEQEKLRRDLALAAEVQRRLLPAQPPGCSAASFSAFTLPARTVGGDYYDFVDLAEERIGIAVADIAGKGIPAALLMSAVQASLRVMAAEHDLPASQLAAQMNRFLYRSTATNSYATFFYAQLDFRNRRLRYVNAGHNPPYLVRRNETGIEMTELSTGGTVLGLFPDVEYESGEIDLCPGDLLAAFTDGVTEARNPGGEEFGEEQLRQFLRESAHASAEEISSSLADRIRRWIAGAEQHDDVTFVIARVH